MTILIIVLIVLLTALGQVLLKIGASKDNASIYFNKFVALGYILFVIVLMLSYFLMLTLPLKYFTVIMSINYVVVMLSAGLFLKDRLTSKKIIGTVLVVAGVSVFVIN